MRESASYTHFIEKDWHNDTSPYAIFVYDLKKVIEVNQTFLKLFGYKNEEDVNAELELSSLVYFDDLQLIDHAREVAREGGPFFIPTIRLMKGNGQLFYAECHVIAIIGNNGPILKIYIRDITGRRNSEFDLIEGGKKYQSLFENSLDGIYKSTPQGKFVEANPALIKMLGYSSLEELLSIDIHEDLYVDTIKNEVGSDQEDSLYILKKKDGSKIWVEDHSYYEFDEIGNIVYHHGIIRDVTDKVEEQKELERLLVLTSRQNEQLQNFTYMMSHNIRSHSSNLSSIAAALIDKQNDDKRKELHDMLMDSTEKLDETIRNLNEIISINSSTRKQFEKCDLKILVSEIVQSFDHKLNEEGIHIEVNIPEAHQVYAISSYLKSIIQNLIENAIRFRSQDKRKKLIKISSRSDSRNDIISISDNGIGIDLDRYGKKLFRMYQTFHYNKLSRGYGLYVTKNQMESMNGSIEVESTVSEGTTFTLYFKKN